MKTILNRWIKFVDSEIFELVGIMLPFAIAIIFLICSAIKYSN